MIEFKSGKKYNLKTIGLYFVLFCAVVSLLLHFSFVIFFGEDLFSKGLFFPLIFPGLYIFAGKIEAFLIKIG